jgi:hypothetical protein
MTDFFIDKPLENAYILPRLLYFFNKLFIGQSVNLQSDTA